MIKVRPGAQSLLLVTTLVLIGVIYFLYRDNQSHRLHHTRMSPLFAKELKAPYGKLANHKYLHVLQPDYIRGVQVYSGSIISKSVLTFIGFNKAAAVTLGNSIYLRNAEISQDAALMAHELAHTAQYREKGVLMFLISYAYYWLTVGYNHVPYESEAFQFGNDVEYYLNRY